MLETLEHLFFHCVCVFIFCCDFQVDLHKHFGKNISLKECDVLLIFKNPNFSKNEQYIINLLIILAKFYIHKIKYLKKLPSYSTFKKSDLDIYFKTISNLKILTKKTTLTTWVNSCLHFFVCVCSNLCMFFILFLCLFDFVQFHHYYWINILYLFYLLFLSVCLNVFDSWARLFKSNPAGLIRSNPEIWLFKGKTGLRDRMRSGKNIRITLIPAEGWMQTGLQGKNEIKTQKVVKQEN
ncbi:MAG: hypothetical protein ATN33_00310 [Epulopiscium sp. Nele67-Bin001]|nr:MAG: hypothetical protein ATN33_00310 [Epulopiscium sp. Nele67-Bin001]